MRYILMKIVAMIVVATVMATVMAEQDTRGPSSVVTVPLRQIEVTKIEEGVFKERYGPLTLTNIGICGTTGVWYIEGVYLKENLTLPPNLVHYPCIITR